MSTMNNPVQDLAVLESHAQLSARQQVASLLSRPDQLEKVEQIRKRVSRKKGSVEAMLKTSIQSQLDGVRTGLNQLQNALKDVQEIRSSLEEVDETYRTISGITGKLKKVREENTKHSQLGAAVENLKHIFTVPETVKKCEDYISDGKLLHAHKCITDLEGSRDDLLFELHQTTQSPTDKNTVNHYFSDVTKLSNSLSKQLSVILQRAIITVRREPTIIVTVLRIIEREERTDAFMLKRYDQTGFLPPGRPKRWRQKAFSVLDEAVMARIEGSQMEDRSMNTMWLVRHMEVTRQLVIEDLKVVKMLCESCFPPSYNIVHKYIQMYHEAIAQHLNEIIQQGLEGNEIVSLLTWVHEYSSKEMMDHPALQIDTSEFGPLLKPTVVDELQNQYLQTMRTNFKEWMQNSLRTEMKDWHKDSPPDGDDKGFFNTSLPIILLQMIEQNLLVASTISDTLVCSVVGMCVDELVVFAETYKKELISFKERHLQNRSEPKYFLHYMIASVNNCHTFAEFNKQFGTKYLKSSAIKADKDRFTSAANDFHQLARDLCELLCEEVFLDLDAHIQELLTRKWLQGSHAVDTICITLEDYCQDFLHLRHEYYDELVARAQNRVAAEYYKALFSRKINFKNYEDRLNASQNMVKEADQLTQLFHKLQRTPNQEQCPFDAIPALAEVVKLRDTSMITLEITDFASNYQDIRLEQMINLIVMRGDIGRGEARQVVVDCLGEDHDLKPKYKKTIFSNDLL